MGELVFQFLDRNDRPVTHSVKASDGLLRWLKDAVAWAGQQSSPVRVFNNARAALVLPDGRVSADPLIDGWSDRQMTDCYEIQVRWESEGGVSENGYFDDMGVGIVLACNDFPYVSYCLSQNKRERFGI